jgi:molybdopterin-binding protein
LGERNRGCRRRRRDNTRQAFCLEISDDGDMSRPTVETKNMKISARNILEGTVKEIKKGSTTAHVLVDVNGSTLTASITNEAVDDLGLKTGSKVKAIVKSSDVMIAID